MAVDLAVVNALVLAGAHFGTKFSLLSYPTHVLGVCAGVLILINLAKEGRPSIRSLLETVRALFVGTVFYYTVAFIYGAFVVKNAPLNVAWSLWMTSLTFLPARAILGDNCCAGWRRMLCKSRPDTLQEADLLVATLGLLVGNWLACVVIPLDWGCAWQSWPIPNVLVGSLAFLLGSLVSHVLYREGGKAVPIIDVTDGKRRSPEKSATPKKSTAPKASAPKSPRHATSPKRSPSPKKSTGTPRKTATPRAKKVEVEVEIKSITTPKTPRRSRARSVSRTPRKSSAGGSRSPSNSPRRSSRRN